MSFLFKCRKTWVNFTDRHSWLSSISSGSSYSRTTLKHKTSQNITSCSQISQAHLCNNRSVNKELFDKWRPFYSNRFCGFGTTWSSLWTCCGFDRQRLTVICAVKIPSDLHFITLHLWITARMWRYKLHADLLKFIWGHTTHICF